MNLKREIENLIRPKIKEAGYEFLRIELKRRGRAQVITIIINKEGGLSVEDCAKVSRLVDPVLEKADLIKGRYFLEVSSPGVK